MAMAPAFVMTFGLAFIVAAPALAFDLALPGARPMSYASIRDATGVLGLVEGMLGPSVRMDRDAPSGLSRPGSYAAHPSTVLGAWQLPPAMQPDAFLQALRARGTVDRARQYRDGMFAVVDYRAPDGRPIALIYVDGTNPSFETKAAPEVRPGPILFVIAYRKR
jgi:hypothetical protein